MQVYLLIFFVATAVTYLMTPVVRRLAHLTDAMTPVRERDIHTTPTPRLGGVAMTTGFMVAIAVASGIPYLSEVFASNKAWAIAWAAAAMCLLGVLDDIWDLDWLVKLAGQIAIVSAMVWQGVQLISFPVFGLTIGSSHLSLVVTVFVVVAAINAVNFVDGLDGLAAGMLGIGGVGFFIYCYLLTRVNGSLTYASLASVLSVALVGICVGFLPHNFYRATIFMGDSGAMVLGLIVSSAAIVVTGQIDPATLGNSQIASAFLPIILPFAVILLPLLDMTLAVIRRTRAGHSPFHPDRLHLHHRLLNAGHSQVRAVLLMYLWTAVSAGAATALIVVSWRTVALVMIPVFAVTILFSANLLSRKDRRGRLRQAPGSDSGSPAGTATISASEISSLTGETSESGNTNQTNRDPA